MFEWKPRIRLVFSFIIIIILVNFIGIITSINITLPNGTVPAPHNESSTNHTVKEEPHFGKLDIRVGKIIDVKKHPDADSLYIEKVNIGEEQPRTIISGLVQHVPIEEMQNRSALFLVNIKPIKMRGVFSEGMIMCAHNDNVSKIEILEPPHTGQPGDIVKVDGYERKPDTNIDVRKKPFQEIQKNLKTNEKKEATYKGIPWNVADKGPVVSLSLNNASIS